MGAFSNLHVKTAQVSFTLNPWLDRHIQDDMFPITYTTVQQSNIYIHLVSPFIISSHLKQWLHNVVQSMGLEVNTVSSDGFKKYFSIQSESKSVTVDGV